MTSERKNTADSGVPSVSYPPFNCEKPLGGSAFEIFVKAGINKGGVDMYGKPVRSPQTILEWAKLSEPADLKAGTVNGVGIGRNGKQVLCIVSASEGGAGNRNHIALGEIN